MDDAGDCQELVAHPFAEALGEAARHFHADGGRDVRDAEPNLEHVYPFPRMLVVTPRSPARIALGATSAPFSFIGRHTIIGTGEGRCKSFRLEKRARRDGSRTIWQCQ